MATAEDYLVYSSGGYREYMGPSTGVDKPTSGFFCGIWTESDTGQVFFYDPANGWTLEFTFQDGDSGTRSANLGLNTRGAMMRGAVPNSSEPETEDKKEEIPQEEAEPESR